MKSYAYLCLILAALVLLAACTDKDLYPIFYTLENERSLADDRGMPDESNVYEVVRAGAGIRYFAAANTIFTRTDTGNWTVVAPPVSGALCNTIEEFGGNLYAGFFTKDGTGLGLYRILSGSTSWDATYTPDTEVQNVQIGLLKAEGGNLYVVTAVQNGGVTDYYLYESADGSTYTGMAVTFDGVSPINLPINDVEDQAGTIWIIAGPYLYQGSPAAVIQNGAGDPVGSGGNPLAGLLYSTGLGQLYVAGKDGKLWMWNGSWNPATELNVDGEDVRFSRFVDVDPITNNDDILVGSEDSGYFTLIGGDVTNTQRFLEYNISALYSGAINSFFLDAAQNALFACTNNTGLWRANYSGTEWIWVQE